jgi:Protein of unknown function (DUF2568)
MRVLEAANLAVRFILELSALAITAYWGHASTPAAARWALAIAAPALVVETARPVRLLVELLLFAAVAAALATTGHRLAAVVFAAVALVSGTLNYIWQ